MTTTQERAIALALNVLHVSFFECTKNYYEYFINNDEWALLMAAAGVNSVDAAPQQLALAVLHDAAGRQKFFEGMTDFKPPEHHCSFLKDKIQKGERKLELFSPCAEGQQGCPHATFENIRDSRKSAPQGTAE